MNFLEKNLEDIIFETDNEKLNERGLNISGKKLRQLRIGNYGIADLVTIKKMYEGPLSICNPIIYIEVYELKQAEINVKTLKQACRYIEGIKEYFRLRNIFKKTELIFHVNLIGNKIYTNDDFVYLLNNCDFATAYTYEYAFDGINFIEDGKNWILTNNGF
jgi:hypothetical protein